MPNNNDLMKFWESFLEIFYIPLITLNCIRQKKNWKPTFPKKSFNEIWVKLVDHDYINIAEIKFW